MAREHAALAVAALAAASLALSRGDTAPPIAEAIVPPASSADQAANEEAASPSASARAGGRHGGTDAPRLARSASRDGASKGLDEPLRASADTVASYTLRATLDPVAHELRGEGTIAWRNASAKPQEELWVHLYLNAFEHERTVFRRGPSGGFRGSGRVESPGFVRVSRFALRDGDRAQELWPADIATGEGEDARDRTDVRVALPRPIAPGESVAIDVAWTARLPSIVLRTGYAGSFHMVGQWFPKIARLEADGTWAHFPFHRLSEFYSDFGDYDVTIDIPAGFAVGATGKQVSEASANGRIERRFVQRDVHDFAFAAWDGFHEAKREASGVALRCLYPEGYEAAAEVELAAASFGLRHMGDAYGPYPYETLTIIHPPEYASEAGGMEYPTLITTGGPWFAPRTGVRSLEIVTIHELAHQWFYGLVATNEHAHPFLDEGLTTYAEVDAMQALFGDASAASALGLRIGLPAVHRATALRGPRGLPIARAAPAFATGGEYGALVYSRMATTLLTLGRVHGEDGLRRALGRYARRHRFAHPGPEGLVDAIAEELGGDAACALETALFEGATVDYSVDRLEPAREAGANDGEAYALVRRAGSLRFPVDVELVGADGSAERVRWDAREPFARIPYRGEAPLAAAIVDPDGRVLLDEDLSNNARRLDPQGVAPRVLDRASFALEALLLLLAP